MNWLDAGKPIYGKCEWIENIIAKRIIKIYEIRIKERTNLIIETALKHRNEPNFARWVKHRRVETEKDKECLKSWKQKLKERPNIINIVTQYEIKYESKDTTRKTS